jgi:RimJ/RimL family protein N-acetyltransferase
MVVTTRRMLLRQMTGADLGWLARLHGDRRVMRYIDDGKPVPRAQVAARTLPAIVREYNELPPGLGYFAAVDRATGRPLGWLSLRPPSSVGLRPGTGVAELGYRLLPEVWVWVMRPRAPGR